MGPAFSTAFDRAIQLAAIVHEPECRKGTRFPYVVHPVHVAMIVQKHGLEEPVVIAAALHDVLEDIDPAKDGTREKLIETFHGLEGAPVGKEEFRAALDAFIEAQFGAEVAKLVRGVTNLDAVDGRELSSEEKHARKIAELQRSETPVGVLALKAADVIHNTRSTANDLELIGLSVMARFNAAPERKLQWYRDVAAVIGPRLEAKYPALASELRESVAVLARSLAPHLDGGADGGSRGRRLGRPEPGSGSLDRGGLDRDPGRDR